ncbi:hypothetical protein IU450_21405 [Nocardia abscessus]|uniref:hypothetical protein n=1 Tax=Nocardia abscessus TaxID=120957 RepID=UPI001892F01B|nr:hypothetical protein [Nocardia abscessus]MBF6338432.1 hypothetical protein [Nocardia abscessus]
MADTFSTTSCADHGHPEFTVVFAEAQLPGTASWLLSYLESSVAAGTRYRPGETIRIGWNLVRVRERADGTLGLAERSDAQTWVEQVDRTLRDVWFQREVAAGAGLADRIDFPGEDQQAIVSSCGLESPVLVLTRTEPGDPEFSGWSVECFEEHTHRSSYYTTLLELAAAMPFAVQFLALPVSTTVLIESPEITPTGTIRPHIVDADGVELSPIPGSYLDYLVNGSPAD